MPTNYLAGIFGPSLLKPLQEHMAIVIQCTKNLPELVAALNQQDMDSAGRLHREIVALEQQADEHKTRIRQKLGVSLLLPIPRRDLLEILQMQDKIANRARDLAGLMVGRQMVFPESLRSEYLNFLDNSITSCAQAETCINELDELFETGFGGKTVDLVDSFLQRLDSIESKNDKLKHDLEMQLMKVEDELPPVSVMFMYRAITLTSTLADQSQRLGTCLNSLITR